jgi:hypothetical protein
VPEDQWPEFKARAIACYHAASPALARMLRDDIAVTHGTALPVRADVLAGRLRGVHCALRPLYTSNSFVQQGSDWTTNVIGFARTVGVSSIRASTIRAMAIMTNAVETNRILSSPLKLMYDTSFSSRLVLRASPPDLY